MVDALEARGFEVHQIETQSDRVASVRAIRDQLLALHDPDIPLDVIAFAGDGGLDHHVLVAAFLAFQPSLVVERPGEVSVAPLPEDELAALDAWLVEHFLSPLPTGEGLEATEANVKRLWVLRAEVEAALQRGVAPSALAERLDRSTDDPVLRFAVLAAVLPHRVRIRAHGFDLKGLATADREQAFQGLYPYVRSITAYPAGTAADNALYAGIPGWGFAQVGRALARLPGSAGSSADGKQASCGASSIRSCTGSWCPRDSAWSRSMGTGRWCLVTRQEVRRRGGSLPLTCRRIPAVCSGTSPGFRPWSSVKACSAPPWSA